MPGNLSEPAAGPMVHGAVPGRKLGCKACIYFAGEPGTSLSGGDFGQCRRRAPSTARFAIVSADAWCGEFEGNEPVSDLERALRAAVASQPFHPVREPKPEPRRPFLELD